MTAPVWEWDARVHAPHHTNARARRCITLRLGAPAPTGALLPVVAPLARDAVRVPHLSPPFPPSYFSFPPSLPVPLPVSPHRQEVGTVVNSIDPKVFAASSTAAQAMGHFSTGLGIASVSYTCAYA